MPSHDLQPLETEVLGKKLSINQPVFASDLNIAFKGGKRDKAPCRDSVETPYCNAEALLKVPV